MAFSLHIHVVESDDATTFKLYDQSDWSELTAFDHTKATSAILSVKYDGVTYTHNITAHLGLGATFINLCGASAVSYYEVSPADLLYSATPLNTTYFPDGYYEILLTVVYNGTTYTDTSYQGFLSESYLMASSLPLQIDLNNFDYEENRLQFLCIALYQGAKWAGELGRSTQFTAITDKLAEFLDAREISQAWST